jgi:hypothetical protein
MENMRIEAYHKGSLLFKKDFENKYSFIILAGKVNLYSRPISENLEMESFYIPKKDIT